MIAAQPHNATASTILRKTAPLPRSLACFARSLYSGEAISTIDSMAEFNNSTMRTRVLANAQARNVEGGRVTDADREVYADAMANALGGPTEENIILAADAILDMKDKGGNISGLLDDLSVKADHPVIGGIIEELFRNMSGISGMSSRLKFAALKSRGRAVSCPRVHS